MSRLVTPKKKVVGGKLAGGGGSDTKEYFERLGKYIPGEIVAAQSTLNALATNAPVSQQFIWLAGSFILGLLLTPFYFARLAKPGEPKRKQMIVATIAFVVWTFSVVGVAGFFGPLGIGWYEPNIAIALLVIFSLVSGLVVPYEGER